MKKSVIVSLLLVFVLAVSVFSGFGEAAVSAAENNSKKTGKSADVAIPKFTVKELKNGTSVKVTISKTKNAEKYYVSIVNSADKDDEATGVKIIEKNGKKVRTVKFTDLTPGSTYTICVGAYGNEQSALGKEKIITLKNKKASENNSDSGKINLTIWTDVTENNSNYYSYKRALDDMSNAYPEISVNVEAFESYPYQTKIKAASKNGQAPDIFISKSDSFLKGLVDDGSVFCLDAEYENYKAELPKSMMGNSTIDGKVYGIPTVFPVSVIFVNMDVLKKVGYTEVPKTYDELIKCCKALKKNDIIPFGCAGKENWCVMEYLDSIMEKMVGAEKLRSLFRGEASWNNKNIASAVNTFQAMIKDYFDPDIVAMSNEEIKQNFINGKYAFYLNGTWNCADIAFYDASEQKFAVAEFPVFDNKKSKSGQLIGGPSSVLAVSNKSEYKDIAAKYVFELSKLVCKYGVYDGCGLPAWKLNYDDVPMNYLTRQAIDLCFSANALVQYCDTAMDSDEVGTYLDIASQIYENNVNGKKFIELLKKYIR